MFRATIRPRHGELTTPIREIKPKQPGKSVQSFRPPPPCLHLNAAPNGAKSLYDRLCVFLLECNETTNQQGNKRKQTQVWEERKIPYLLGKVEVSAALRKKYIY